jgi:hypothetical protein
MDTRIGVVSLKLAIIPFLLLPLAAQEIKFPPNLEQLASKAAEVVDVTMDASMLQLASRFLSEKDADQAKVKKLVAGLKGVYVKSFEFDNPGEYSQSDLESIRSQLRAPEWSRVVGVRSRKSSENAEVYMRKEGDKIGGLTIIATEPKELTIVNIVGPIDPEMLSELGGHFGIPSVETRKDERTPKKED